jgi:UTP--glucose-1-phosphate uridylyltransferase
MSDLANRITFIPQHEPAGFGHAVYCARQWVGDEPFLLMLGDHLHQSTADATCAQQLLAAYARQSGRSMIAVHSVHIDQVVHYGTVCGHWVDDEHRSLELTELAEKPTADYATQYLRTAGTPEDEFLCVSGLYVLTPAVFDALGESIQSERRERGEFQLTSALDNVRLREGMTAALLDGAPLDTGLPETYPEAVAKLAGLL